MRLQLADGPKCRKYKKRGRRGAMSDGGGVFGKILQGVSKAAQNPKVQKAAGNVLKGVGSIVQSGILKKKNTGVTGGVPATIPASSESGLPVSFEVVNMLTGANETITLQKAEIEELKRQNKSLSNQRIYYGVGGVVFGIAVGALFFGGGGGSRHYYGTQHIR